ncbi:hypothetical protein GC207_07670 [bacterium]|nr:hypothetical protein [bacterium]
MKAKHLFGSLITIMMAAGSTTLLAQTNQLHIYTAIEVEYQTEQGNTYTLQGSVGLTNWVDIGTPILGNGQIEDRIFSTKDSTVNYASYRLLITPGPTNGYAPWTLEGVSLQMDDSKSSNAVQYLSSTNGQDVYVGGSDPFTFHYSRSTGNDGRVERRYSPTRRDILSYTFTGPGIGSWVRDEFEYNVLKSHDVGAFRYLDYGTNNVGTNTPPVIVDAQPPAPPSSLTGLVYYAFTGPYPDKYQFNLDNTGIATPGSSSDEVETSNGGNAFTYSYSVLSTNTASLVINFGYYGIGGDRQEYDLTFNDGSSALFNRRIYRLGSLFTTDNGVFSPNALAPTFGGGRETNSVPTTPPTDPTGFVYTMFDSSTPERLAFQTSISGMEFGDSAPSEFTYTYVATGLNTFHVVVTFKPDKWDEYDLTFSSGSAGSMVVHRYDKNSLKRIDGGAFSVEQLSP